MTAAIQTRGAGPRLKAIASIIRKDVRLFGWYAAAGALAMFVVSAFFHAKSDFPAMLLHFGNSQLHVDAALFGLSSVGVPVALMLFIVILVQADIATDMQRDWLVRPVAPLEIVAAKMALILAVVLAPMIAGNLVYMMTKPMPAALVFGYVWPMFGGCILVLAVSWLFATPFRALLSVIGMFLLFAFATIFAILIKFVIAVALTGAPDTDVTPFPLARDNWMLGFGGDIGLFTVSGLTLWLLLARRKPAAARWLFLGYSALWFFVRFLLFVPN